MKQKSEIHHLAKCGIFRMLAIGLIFLSIVEAQEMVTVPFDVANAGFEDGLSGWDGGKSMSLDPKVFHGGRYSARLTVVDPKKDPVYITRLIPIKGGALYEASCFVKTENVRDAEGSKDSVGAGLIVEWADSNRKWLQSGAYACGRYGTSGWKSMVCNKQMNAPEKAAYAIIYLALRAAGTAWFDDITFAEVQMPTEKLSPSDGAVVSNNCPRFAWKPLPGIRRYELEMSTNPSFPPEAVRTFDVGGFETFQVEAPLAPGVWYWRVNSKGRVDPDVRSFTQTEPMDRDCLAPSVLTKAFRVTESSQPVVVRIKDVCVLLPDVRFGGSKGRYAGADGRGVLQYVFAAPHGGWAKGLTEGEIVAVDSSGNKSVSPFYLLNASKPTNGVTVAPDGSYCDDGKRIYPLGIYEVAPKYMAEVRTAGYDVVHSYEWEFSPNDAACRRYLDACWATDGLRAFIGFDRGVNSKKGIVQGNFAHVARRVGALANHPGLFCWYLFDEPEIPGQFVTPDRLAEFADFVRALDPYHAVVMTSWASTMNEYRRTWDSHWTQAYQDPASVVKQIDEHRRYLKNDSPITLLLGCQDVKQGRARRKGIKPDPEKFMPDYDHMRACAFIGVVKGCNGLFWWPYARDTDEYYPASQNPKAWAGLVEVVKEIRSVRPLVTAEGEVETGTVKSGKACVEWWHKAMNGRNLFIAVNTADHPVSVTMHIPGKGMGKVDFLRYEVKHNLVDSKSK